MTTEEIVAYAHRLADAAPPLTLDQIRAAARMYAEVEESLAAQS